MRVRKLRFFEIGSAALSAVTEHKGIYACPVCQRGFDVSAVESGILTLEDSPPQSLGGRPIALTCKDCNSVAGYTIDAALKNREKFIDLNLAMAGKGGSYRGNARLITGGVTTNVRLEFEEQNLTVEIPRRMNHPDNLRKHQAARPPREEVEPGDPRAFQIQARAKFKWRHAGIGDLKAAYIAAFAMFGYRYAFESSLDLVREQIRNPDAELIRPACWYKASQPPRGPVILGLNGPFRGLLIQLGRAMVGLPWGGDAEEFYRALSELLSRGKVDLSVTGLALRPRDAAGLRCSDTSGLTSKGKETVHAAG